MRAALWGNQADLGFALGVAAASGAGGLGRVPNLVVDDTDATMAVLSGAERVHLVADNAGRELLADLVLIDHLLAAGTRLVSLHLKPAPYYVSDAVTADLVGCLRLLAGGPPAAAELAGRLRAAAAQRRLEVAAHWFYCAPFAFDRMPPDLAADLAASSVVVVKGDLNYRRLVGDLQWPPTTPFAEATAYFPAPVVALRTLKSDVIVGLPGDVVRTLCAESGDWRTSGRYGLVQFRP
jgi:hypothetical protein